MSFAIASTSDDTTGVVSDRGGRAPYYLYFDDNKTVQKAVKNPFAVGSGGAGFSVAKMLENDGISMVVIGKVGEKMRGALEDRGITLLVKNGTVEEILNEI